MESQLIKLRNFNLIKGVSFLLIAVIIIANSKIGYTNFTYLIGGSIILSSIIHLAAGLSNVKKSVENNYLLIIGLTVIVGSISILAFLSQKYPYYSNRIILSYWLVVQIVFLISYMRLIFRRSKKQFKILVLFFTILIFLTFRALFNDKQSFAMTFVIFPFVSVGVLNIYVHSIFRKYKQNESRNSNIEDHNKHYHL